MVNTLLSKRKYGRIIFINIIVFRQYYAIYSIYRLAVSHIAPNRTHNLLNFRIGSVELKFEVCLVTHNAKGASKINFIVD